MRLRQISIALIALFVLMAVFHALGARVNTTRSISVGLYWVCDPPAVRMGSYAMFCPPPGPLFDLAKERGYTGPGLCPGGHGYLMKRILAVGGDEVLSNEHGVFVNGSLLPLSKPLPIDHSGRPLPCFRADTYVLSDDEALFMSDVSATSFDGRYYGPIGTDQIKHFIKPILVW